MSAPWLSVVMPIFNGEATLQRTLDTLKGQSEGLEIIAVDQASTDGSRSILEHEQANLNLTIIDAPDSKSWMENTNIALNAAHAPHATMLHQDDLWHPGRAKHLRWHLGEEPGASLWLHAANYVDDNDRVVGKIAPPFCRQRRSLSSQFALRRLLVQNTIALPAAMFRVRDVVASGGLDETLWYTADWDLWLRLAQLGSVAWSPETLASFRIHAGSQTVTGSKEKFDQFLEQLDVPVRRHLPNVAETDAAGVQKLAKLSNRLNVYLAGSFHGTRTGFGGILRDFVMLGPRNWLRFFRDTQILARVMPRLRLGTKSR